MSAASTPRVLVVDDEPDLRTLYELALLREGFAVETAADVGEGLRALAEQAFDVVITDMRLPDGSGLDILHHLEQGARSERSLVITAYGSAENAVEALKAGAFDYLTKPVDLRQFRNVVASAIGRTDAAASRPSTRASPRSAPPRAALQRMAGRSLAIESVRQLVARVARSMAPVLVNGESGTGKELVARAVHEASPRAGGPFVAVNCGAIPEQLLEAEFFGVRKGAFTGAQEDRAGFFQAADGGTLFLDEIGELPLSMQPKLLRVIQERVVRPVGATAESAIQVRIVCATHRDLAADVAAGRFRQDLFYRLNVIPIRVPPLRDRLDDLPAIAEHLLERIARDGGIDPAPRLAPPALQWLARQAFPGNVRELENLLHRAVALCAGPVIELDDLGVAEAQAGPVAAPVGAPFVAPGGPEPASAVAPDSVNALSSEASCVAPSERPSGDPLPADLAAHLDAVERTILLKALELHRFNRTAAGAGLGLSLRQMRYRMARLGITAPGDAAESATETTGEEPAP